MKKNIKPLVLLLTGLVLTASIYAQTFSTAINSGTGEVKNTFTPVVGLVYAVAGVIGLIGALICYRKWQSGDPHLNNHIIGWFGSSLFLFLAPTVLKAIFG